MKKMDFDIDLDLVELDSVKRTLKRLIDDGLIQDSFTVNYTKRIIEKLEKQEKRIEGGF